MWVIGNEWDHFWYGDGRREGIEQFVGVVGLLFFDDVV